MKWNSIRTKVLAALLVCLIVGAASIMGLMHYSFERNSRVLATESVSGAQRLFSILESREISKMTAVSDTLLTNPQVRDAFAAKNREKLSDVTVPLYPQLKANGITNWMFHTPEPDMTVFLRLHNPSKFGDHLNRFLDKEGTSGFHRLFATKPVSSETSKAERWSNWRPWFYLGLVAHSCFWLSERA
jgi:Double sensory domain of two-component sensor kinase